MIWPVFVADSEKKVRHKKTALFTMALFCFAGLASGQSKDNTEVELDLLYSFPNEQVDEVLLAQPTRMAIVDSLIFIMDYGLNAVLKYDLNGRLLQMMDNRGEGPGEFWGAFALACTNDKLYLVDSGNARLQMYDLDFAYLGSFKIMSHGFDIPVHEGLIYNQDLSELAAALTDEKGMIAVLNEQGRVVKRFGDYLDLTPNYELAKPVNKSWMDLYKGRLYVLSKYYPILRVYALDGTLEQTIEFESRGYKKRVRGNYDWSRLVKGTTSLPTRYLFRAIDVNERGIFVGLYSEDLIIDHYDQEGNFIRRLKKKPRDSEEPYYLHDFEVRVSEDGELLFYILNEQVIPEMGVFKARS